MPADLDWLLTAALERPPADRASFLDEACGTDAAARAEIDRLLRELDDQDPFLTPGGALDGPFGGDLLAVLDQDEGIPFGTRIGPYRIAGELGRGGMALVYLAERADGAFSQQVALKVVKRGIDTDEVIARFRQERQILASLTHPGIARLVDGGVTPDGRPYLAMEFVEGEPIDRYCDRLALDVDRRVDLCIAVARAVEHAHQRLVVHRDLKPSNILIGAYGDIKLLDFGIAKLLDPSTVDHAAPPTRTTVRVMTPEYASPEQVRGDTITTASDVYQLGLILFELLTGRRAHVLAGRGAAEVERVVCDTPAPRPSAVVAGAGADADRRRKQLRGDLDNILLTALAKEPDRRYGSVDQLAADLVRYRQGRPVVARGRSWRYRTGKFVRRHLAGVGAAAAVVVVVAAIVAFYSVRLAGERDRARREAATATGVAEFLTGLFRASDPNHSAGASVTARELLARGAERIDSELAGQPEVRTRLMNVIGNIYRSLGLYQDAISVLERALETRLAELGPDHPDVAQSRYSLGFALYNAGRLGEARGLLEEARRVQESTKGLPPLDLTATLNALGLLHRREGRLPEARDTLQQALAIREQALGREHRDLAVLINNLALVHQSLGEYGPARGLYERALAIHERHRGAEHPLVSGTLGNLADVIRLSGDPVGARPLQERALAIAERVYGSDHRDTATAINALGMLLEDLGLRDEARAHYERSADIYLRTLGPTHAYLAYPLANLGDLYAAAGDDPRALEYQERALEIRLAAFGEVHRDVSFSLERVGSTHVRMNDCGKAVPVLERALDASRKTLSPDHPRIAQVSSALEACAEKGTVSYPDAIDPRGPHR
jgi:eukaryotic-like serine/threonine-protein kinase